jgi:hypothetical protein
MSARARLLGTLRTFLLLPIVCSAAVFAAPDAAYANMIRLDELREIKAVADCEWAHAAEEGAPLDQWDYWFGYVGPVADLDEPDRTGWAYANAFQVSEFLDNGIQFSGGTGGGWGNIPGTYTASSLVYFLFYVESCSRYRFFSEIDPGDGFSNGHVILRSPFISTEFETNEAGTIDHYGLLGPGTYFVEGLSSIQNQSQESQNGPVVSLQWTCVPCDTPRIWQQPRDTLVVCGTTVSLNVIPGPFAQAPMWEWRRNGVPLTDGGNISGSSTPTLTIQNACTSDGAYYDVRLTDGTVVEPSRLARLRTATSITGVDEESGTPGARFSIAVAGPNPFAGGISFRYSAASPVRASMAIYDASGRRVRQLVNGMVSGTGTVRWDGTTSVGVRAPAGIYFLRAEAGSIRENRKVVLLR